MSTREQAMSAIKSWESKLNQAGIIFDPNYPGNVSIVLGYISNNLDDNVTENNLTVAARACHAALRYSPGHEPPDPRADAKAKAKADADELERKRRRDVELKAGITNQGRIKTEFDRVVADKPRVSQAEILEAAKRDFDLQEHLPEINHLIENHSVNNGNHVNHAKTSHQRNELREKRDKLIRQKTSGKQILTAIQQLQESFCNNSVR